MKVLQKMRTFKITTQQQREAIFDPNNLECPFHGYVGNEEAVRIAIRIAKKAFDSRVDIGLACGAWNAPVWACNRENPVRMLVTGARSVGKTTFAKKYAYLVGTNYDTGVMEMPWVEIDACAINKREDVLEKISQAMRAAAVPMIPDKCVGQIRHYRLPPLVLFIDEVHRLQKKVLEGLLKMTESNDGLFEVNNSRVDCRRITIICATTDPGKLLDTFKSRFPIKIALKKHTLEQVARIIQDQTDWDEEAAMRLARMKPLPREALEIAKLIDSAADTEGCSVEEAIDIIASDLGLSEGGLSQRAIDVLMALGDAQPTGLSRANLCAQLDGMDESEFRTEIVPQLMKNEFHPSLINVSSRHKITEAGLDELRIRSLIDY